MAIEDKFSTTKDNFIEFINGLDEDFSSLKDSAIEYTSSLNGDIRISVKGLQELANQTLYLAKKKKNEILLEKSKVSQQIMNQYSGNNTSATYDFANNLRSIIQKNHSHYELLYNEGANRFHKPVIGSLWKETDEWLAQINESALHEAHRSHDVQLYLSQDVIDHIFANLRASLTNFAKNDIEILNQRISSIKAEISEYLESCSIQGLDDIEQGFDLQSKYDELITSCLRIEMPYQGNYTKASFRNLMFEMRSFSMMFLLLLSSFGVNRYIATDDQSRTIVSIVSLVLIVIGVLVTFAKTQDSKEDKLEDELEKAKERMTTEIKRAVSEFVSEWKSIILTNFKTIMTDISAEADKLVREDAKRKSDNVLADRMKLNILSQQLDAKDRSYQELIRKCETWKMQIDGTVNEIQKSIQ